MVVVYPLGYHHEYTASSLSILSFSLILQQNIICLISAFAGVLSLEPLSLLEYLICSGVFSSNKIVLGISML
jgi:hypothetical protein